ncbi:RING-H2 finger protein ATL66-like protein [Cinnamomum micranthum f. kanehirae]|uniref:RING-H2 finger protein ATL66-like protein n=1 Tax=Cinnamomum micranthum f. kanehirae TaxID=337451 RepID=A0A443NS36_9MAGN|nr:RING-H2 finger protein ATL66-like protein [Cinnamomum micranthum f. kanehirae]
MASQDSQPFHWHYGELNDKNFQLHGRGLLLLIILFSICLVFTLICLYAKWMCRYRQLAASGTGSPQLHLPSRAQSTGLDPLAINSLPIHLHHSPAAGEVQCCICLSSFQKGEKVKVLPDCNHSFHPECVDMWLSHQSSCPLCRASLHTCKVEPAHELV